MDHRRPDQCSPLRAGAAGWRDSDASSGAGCCLTPQCDREATRGDFKIYGRVADVADPDLRERYSDTIFAAIDWRPTEPYPLYAVDIESAAYISFGDQRKLLRCSPERGVEKLTHPDDLLPR